MLKILVAILVAIAAGPQSLHATSLTRSELATATTLSISVVTGALAFEPIPQLDRDALDREIQALMIAGLRDAGLSTDPTSNITLRVYVDHDWQPETSAWVAISVRLELVEPISIDRELPPSASRTLTGVTWSDQTLDLVKRDEVLEMILFRVQSNVESFAANVNQARAHLSEHHRKQ